jgi:hypothetical protein
MKINSMSLSGPHRRRFLSAGICLAALAIVTARVLGGQEQSVATPKPKEVTRQKTVVLVDGQTVWEVKADELPGIGLKFMAGLQRLPNGNTVMSNWLGHGQLGKAPHLIEIARDKRVLWTFFDHQTMASVSSVQLLDVPGDATKGEVWH